ncbi:MAG TPA: response regulator transcription factor [Flavobacteriaceae bacterium]|nr:response regulator transcription factor [Flavobacteriaceae bacterium]
MPQIPKKILLVEDDVQLHTNIKEALIADGFEVEGAFDDVIAERMLKTNTYDCLLIDLNLPGKNGYEICADFRETDAHTPILILTAFDSLDDKVKGFEHGADDYLTKPFYIRELILRIHALLKRSVVQETDEEEYSLHGIHVNHTRKKVTRNGQDIDLTRREYQVLLMLLKRNGDFVSKKELIEAIWGSATGMHTNTIEVYINFLRNKMDKPFKTENIKTKIGYGYYIGA